MGLSAVLFDLYGTLVDIWTDEWDPETYRILSRFLSYYQVFYHPEELAARYQEKAAEKMLDHPGPFGEIDVFQVFEEILAEGLGQQPERSLVFWLARLFRCLTQRHLNLFPDTLPALEELGPQYQLGLVSDAQWVFCEPEIRLLGLSSWFDPIVLSSRYFIRKPDPQIYQHALKSLRLPPDQALCVGNDPEVDLPGPQALGLPVVLIDRQGQFPGVSVPVIRDLRELPSLIEKLYT